MCQIRRNVSTFYHSCGYSATNGLEQPEPSKIRFGATLLGEHTSMGWTRVLRLKRRLSCLYCAMALLCASHVSVLVAPLALWPVLVIHRLQMVTSQLRLKRPTLPRAVDLIHIYRSLHLLAGIGSLLEPRRLC